MKAVLLEVVVCEEECGHLGEEQAIRPPTATLEGAGGGDFQLNHL